MFTLRSFTVVEVFWNHGPLCRPHFEIGLNFAVIEASLVLKHCMLNSISRVEVFRMQSECCLMKNFTLSLHLNLLNEEQHVPKSVRCAQHGEIGCLSLPRTCVFHMVRHINKLFTPYCWWYSLLNANCWLLSRQLNDRILWDIHSI